MQILTVSELTSSIKKQLENAFAFVSVQGEISNLKHQASGHLYFTLKDSEAQISAVLFKGQARNLSRLPKEGDKVVLQGEISVYAPRGNYQLLVRDIQFVGVGELLLKLHELKAKLEKKGRFDPSHKKPLPKYPRTIGVITSPTGAVIQDILNILNRRFSGFHLILNPVKVQGEGAALEIAKAIEQFNRHSLADVLIVGRGGGSLEDLWAFNEEVVVEAIYHSQIPIISAVGHETDFSLSDFVADIRAPTPSAAAEIVMAEKAAQLKFLDQAQARLLQVTSTHLKTSRRRLQSLGKHPYLISPYLLLSSRLQRIDEVKLQLDASVDGALKEKKLQMGALQREADALKPLNQIRSFKQKFLSFEKSLKGAWAKSIQEKQKLIDPSALRLQIDQRTKALVSHKAQKFSQLVSHLKAVNPKNLLTKGYCILFSEKKDSVILSAKDLELEQKLFVLMQDGQVTVKVEEIV